MLAVIIPSATDLVLKHESRLEPMDAGGMLVGVDLTKHGTDIAVPETVIVRRIGTEAVSALVWVANAQFDSIVLDLVSEMENRVLANESYANAWKFLKNLVLLNKASFHVFYPACAIKFGVYKAPMDTVYRRTMFAKLLRESDGTADTREMFNASEAFRWLVVEPYETLLGGGYMCPSYPFVSVGAVNSLPEL